MKERIFLFLFFCIFFDYTQAQVTYPYPLQNFSLTIENKRVEMAYMDVIPPSPNGKTVILFHGKNFNGYYWKDVIPLLVEKGYRVIIPDQVGWGRSGKPDLHYSFHMLAMNNKLLLDSLKINSVIVVGHSMGGMLAIRFTLLYPGATAKVVLENPIGLEDYKTFVPYQTIDKFYEKERAATYESYKKYQQSYYPVWKPEYEQYVKAQAEALTDPAFDRVAWVNAITYQMIYEQPVIYELRQISVPVLLIIGQSDRTVVGKDLLREDQKNRYGQYPQLGKKVKQLIPGSRLVELNGVGHIPHIQVPELFKKTLFDFL
ncbi:MAG: alpha/beta hydrolase [Ferruginibacter sp.]|nr:alpha/beta hydrolase [Chitinophagaceae bacterium]